jgi:hypothetical protein
LDEVVETFTLIACIVCRWRMLNDTGTPLNRDLLLLKLFFGRHADPAALLEQVRAFREAKERELELLADYGHQNLKHPAGVFRNLTVGFGLDLTQSSITWASEAIRTLGELL